MPDLDVKDIAEKLAPMQAEFKALTTENDAIVAAFEVKDGTVVVTTEQQTKFQSNIVRMKELRNNITTMTEAKTLAEFGLAPGGDPAAIAAAAAAAVANGGSFQRKSLGERFVESDEFKMLDGGQAGYTMRTPFNVKTKDGNGGSLWVPASGVKDVYGGGVTGTAPPVGFGPRQLDGFVPPSQRTKRVRDLFPVQQTSATVIDYFRVTGYTNSQYTGDANAASVVPERDGAAFGLKPKTSLTFTEHQATVRTIAHYEVASRTVLADVPQLRGIIDNELLYGLKLTEDDQILNGTNTGQDLQGILNVPGIQSYSWSAGATTPVPDNKADALRRAATRAILAYYEPTGVVVHPSDWEDIELAKSTQGEYLLAVSIALGGEQRVWRMPVVDTPAMKKGTALVGAFGLGAQLYDREEGNVRIAEQHADFFIRNAVVILAEERLALAVKRPESFVKVTFDNAPA